MKIKLIAWSLLSISLGSCYNDKLPNITTNPNGCDSTDITFSQNIRPLLDQQCASCHAAAVAQTLGGSYNLDGYSNVSPYADTSGLLIKAISGDPSVSQMPPLPAGKLSDCHIAQVQKWIKEGAPNN